MKTLVPIIAAQNLHASTTFAGLLAQKEDGWTPGDHHFIYGNKFETVVNEEMVKLPSRVAESDERLTAFNRLLNPEKIKQ